MKKKIFFKGLNLNNKQKERLNDRVDLFEDLDVSNLTVIFTSQKDNYEIKMNLVYDKKNISIQKKSKDIEEALNNAISIGVNQIEKLSSKKSHKDDLSRKEFFNDDFKDSYELEKLIKNKGLEPKQASNNFILNKNNCFTNEGDKRLSLSFENACIKLELLGYDMFFYKDSSTNNEMVVFKENDSYLVQQI